ncbi:MAG: RNA polymerase sigma factor [Steroidobacteraceae bacterium]|nr:RNA polymerase sigma factor [Steroidobacteraceae bacterium]
MSSFSDSALPAGTVEQAQRGEMPACEAIFRAFEVPVRTLARRLVPRRALAEDLAQDVFVEILAKLGQFDGRGSFAGWVRAITVNRCLMHLRSPWHRSMAWIESGGAGEFESGPCAQASDGANLLDLERAMAQLAPVARAVVWLHDVEGYTHAEIGALFGGSTSFSKSQLARAHERLRGLLEPDGVEASCMPVSTSS